MRVQVPSRGTETTDPKTRQRGYLNTAEVRGDWAKA